MWGVVVSNSVNLIVMIFSWEILLDGSTGSGIVEAFYSRVFIASAACDTELGAPLLLSP